MYIAMQIFLNAVAALVRIFIGVTFSPLLLNFYIRLDEWSSDVANYARFIFKACPD